VKPPFTYFGGKTAIADQIVSLQPPHEHYIEPFAGSLAVLLAKPPSRMETVNDLDGGLVNFWRQLRDRPDDLIRVCALTPHSRAEYLASYDMAGADDLERARRFWVRLTQGRGAQMRRTGWRYYQKAHGGSSMPDYLDGYVSRMTRVTTRLHAVSLECKPALDLVRDYGRHSNCLIYADPPYLGSVRTLNKGRCRGPDYSHELRSDDEHRELIEALLSCESAVVLSGYASELYDDLLGAWHRREIATQTGNGGFDRSRVEVVWSNRPFPVEHPMLFDLAASG
jgi:DNA adenine methylase